MSQNLSPTVCLDSDAIRSIREEKKLTQLYVAKVVGVTTDTVSRWENNRYPSIKRENALKLAEALEVGLDDILEKATDKCSIDPTESVAGRRRLSPVLVGALVLVAAGAVAAWLLLTPASDPLFNMFDAGRVLPNYAAPSTVIPIRVRMTSDGSVKGFILREHFPEGWKLVEASPPPSSLDNERGMARWIVKPGENRASVVYRIRVADDAELGRTAAFGGEVILNPKGRSVTVPVGGVDQVQIARVQWADLNGDGIIDDGEMLEASDTVDAMKGVHMDWEKLEEIWDAGGYRWSAEKEKFVPQRPAPEPAPTGEKKDS